MCIAALFIIITIPSFIIESAMKPLMLAASIVCALIFLLIVPQNISLSVGASENHCFTCHTNPRKLIQITREIAKAHKGNPAKSSEIAGEG
jgi:hypothetical protein